MKYLILLIYYTLFWIEHLRMTFNDVDFVFFSYFFLKIKRKKLNFETKLLYIYIFQMNR